MVFEELPRASLASLAATCQDFHESALRILWRECGSLQLDHFAKFLPKTTCCSRRGPAEVRGRGSVSNREFVMAALELPCKQVQIFFRVLLEKSSARSSARSARVFLRICLKLCRWAQYPAMHSHIDFREKNRTLRWRVASGLSFDMNDEQISHF